jgi:outer membrane protein OmpA-like peptidoglycan-associated protein
MTTRLARLARLAPPAAAFLSLCLAPTAARAQATGFAIDRFNPSERGSTWFAEDSLDFRGQVRPAVGLVAEYAARPLVIVNADGSTNSSPVKDQLILHPGAAVAFLNRFRAAFDLPVGVFEDGNAGAVKAVGYPATAGCGLGDLRLSGVARLFGEYGSALTLAAGLAIFVPTGSQSAYLSDGNARVMPRVAVAGDVGIFAYAAHLAFMVRPLSNAFPGYPTGSELDLGASAGLRLLGGRLTVGPEVYGSTVVTDGSAAFSTRQTPLEGLVGAHYGLSDEWRLGAGVAFGLTRGFGEPVARGTLAIEWAPKFVAPVTDRDKDFIPDSEDACPDVPGVKSPDPKKNGCPAPDRDKDGVPDAVDACPDVPGEKTDDPLTNGCPADRDRDGVPDSLDKCIDVPGVHQTDASVDGCPPDADHDGIVDWDDACPNVAGIKTDDPKTNGCPDLDRDKDGIPNAEDACPDVAGPRDPDPKRNGCPEAYVQDDVIKVFDAFKFVKPPAAALLLTDAETKRGLDGVLAFLKAHPEVKRVRIEGHTDNQGDAARNRALSAQRAKAVIAWLTKQGIDASRLNFMGVGGDSPVQDNATEEGRAANQRVELHVEP